MHADIGKDMIQDTPMEINEAKHNQVGTDKIDCSVCEEKYDNITKYTHHLNSHLQIVGHPIEDGPESIGNGKYRLEVNGKADLELPTKSENLLTQSSDETSLIDKGDVYTYGREIDTRILFSCTMCDKFFASKYDLTRHIDNTHITSQFHCSLCKKQFSSKHHVQRHIDSVHKKLKPFSCTECKKSFAEKHNLDRHVILIHKKVKSGNRAETYTPSGKYTTASDKIIVEEKDKSDSPPTLKAFACTLCGKSFSSAQHLERHIKFHTKDKCFSCTECDKMFYTNSCVARHINSVHKRLRPFTCLVCEKSFGLKQDLDRHYRRVHKNLMSLPKEEWPKEEWPKEESTKTTREKSFSCVLCDKLFYTKQHVDRHIKSVHMKLKPFSCTFCDKSFAGKQDRDRHVIAIHKGAVK